MPLAIWSPMTSVEYPRSSICRARSAHCAPEAALKAAAPNRNGVGGTARKPMAIADAGKAPARSRPSVTHDWQSATERRLFLPPINQEWCRPPRKRGLAEPGARPVRRRAASATQSVSALAPPKRACRPESRSTCACRNEQARNGAGCHPRVAGPARAWAASCRRPRR